MNNDEHNRFWTACVNGGHPDALRRMQKFARLVPGEKKCAACQGMLPLDLTAAEGGERR
ncbi:hypothetical protein [Amycolatopsis sp. WGS_07]|uniref:hypothetical protein n=1 Tax=Amycolatopsis sp. WGS_07 TaxID=3076764 RepID=UPI0038738A3B